MHASGRMHGTCVARDGAAVLIIGPSGSGKSDLALRLLARGFSLVADDQVDIAADGSASPPDALAGLLEIRGLGIVQLPWTGGIPLYLVVELGPVLDRLPNQMRHPTLDLPMLRLDPVLASAPERVVMALDCALGRVRQIAGTMVA